MNLNENEMRETAARICRDYLTGAWRTVAPADLQFKRISGGLSNFLYHVALPESPPASPAPISAAPPKWPLVTVIARNGAGLQSAPQKSSTAAQTAATTAVAAATAMGETGASVLAKSAGDVATPDSTLAGLLNNRHRDATVTAAAGGSSSYGAIRSKAGDGGAAHGPDGEPKQVLLRIYGQVHGEQAIEAIITESVVFTLLSERRLGPKLHGVFPGGRIEQYIPARPLKTSELSDPVLSVKIAEKMAAVHSMDVPLSKEPDWLWKTMNGWLHAVENNLNSYKRKDDHESRLVEKIISYRIRSEIEWLRQYIETVDSPVVFSHNDMQEGNILLREACDMMQQQLMSREPSPEHSFEDLLKDSGFGSQYDNNHGAEGETNEHNDISSEFSQQMALRDDVAVAGDSDSFFEKSVDGTGMMRRDSVEVDCCFDRLENESTTDSVLSRGSSRCHEPELVLIDFEYCSYNYRGFDLANHFIEWSYDYSNKDHPYFHDRPENYPTQEQQERFITAYLQSSRRYRNGRHSARSDRTMSTSSRMSGCCSSTSSSRGSFDAIQDAGSGPLLSAEIARISQEIRAFTMASHLFWGMWATVNASLSQIPFGYWDYAASRLDRYFDTKQSLVRTLSKSSALKRKINDLE